MSKAYVSETLRYLIVGMLTTLVNLACFHLLVVILGWDVTIGNILSVVVAILFAFVANKYVVFQSITTDFQNLTSEFIKFVAGRLITMVIEVGGVFLLHNVMGFEAMPSKAATQVIVIVLNYFISKFLVFNA